jgi:hypothetical protein
MRRAWDGALSLSPQELAREELGAFKANWLSRRRERAAAHTALDSWRDAARSGAGARRLALRVREAQQRRAKARGLDAFARFSLASQLVEAAAQARLQQRRALGLVAVYTWRADALRARFHLLWERWRRRAVGRVRLRAFLAAHMRR